MAKYLGNFHCQRRDKQYIRGGNGHTISYRIIVPLHAQATPSPFTSSASLCGILLRLARLGGYFRAVVCGALAVRDVDDGLLDRVGR